jgi:hypothetical protein
MNESLLSSLQALAKAPTAIVCISHLRCSSQFTRDIIHARLRTQLSTAARQCGSILVQVATGAICRARVLRKICVRVFVCMRGTIYAWRVGAEEVEVCVAALRTSLALCAHTSEVHTNVCALCTATWDCRLRFTA